MCMADCCGEFSHFRKRGFNMIVPDFIGYGMSGGNPSEQGVYATADAAFDYLVDRDDIDKQKIIPFGWSSAPPPRPSCVYPPHPGLIPSARFTAWSIWPITSSPICRRR